MKILHVTPSFYPATYWGGPIWSTKAICDGIAALPDMTLRVLTTDAAGPAISERVRRPDLPYPVHYAARIAGHSIAPGLWARLPAAIFRADVVHLSGTYSAPTLPTLALARLMAKPVVWSPRGALQATEDWAGTPRRSAKQKFERAANLLRPTQTVLHVTAGAEATQSVKRLGGIATYTVPNCVDIPRAIKRNTIEGTRCRLMVLGRLHPKKGLLELCEAIDQVGSAFTLDIYGTGDAAFTEQLCHKVARSGGRIRMHGHVEGEAKLQAFAGADLFVLPSHSENFGIAVAEAMAHGLPVLTTTGTPWQDVERMGCGRCIDLANDSLADEIVALSRCDLLQMGAKARAWMRRDFASEAMVMRFAALYRDLGATAAARVPA